MSEDETFRKFLQVNTNSAYRMYFARERYFQTCERELDQLSEIPKTAKEVYYFTVISYSISYYQRP